jgi:uncharacterized protein (DUF983 family)
MKFQVQAILDLANDLMSNNFIFCNTNIWFLFYIWIPMIIIYSTICIPYIMEISIYDNINASIMIYNCNVKF